jgi:hypothetical protein
MYYVWQYKTDQKFWWKNVKKRDHLGVRGTDVRITLKYVNNKYITCEISTELLWLRTKSSFWEVAKHIINVLQSAR